MKAKFYRLLALVCVLCASANALHIAAAANLSKVIYELKDEYLKHHKDDIQITLNASGALVLQIQNGAPYGVFMAADEGYANSLNKKDTKLYAKGCLALYARGGISHESIKDTLASAKCIVIANPKTAPYGAAALKYIQSTLPQASQKLITAHSISHALSMAKQGCGVGFVALSNAIFDEQLKTDEYINLGCDIRQNVALLDESGREFYEFLSSQKAKEIFQKYGYEQ